MSTLHEAAQAGNATKARALIDSGSNVQELNSAGMTPLHVACSFGGPMGGYAAALAAMAQMSDGDIFAKQAEVVRLLLAAGANPNAATGAGLPGMDGFAPLHLACGFLPDQKLEIITALIEAGADVNAALKTGDTPYSMFMTHTGDLDGDDEDDEEEGGADGESIRRVTELFKACGAKVTESLTRWQEEKAREKELEAAVNPDGELRVSRSVVKDPENAASDALEILSIALKRRDYDLSKVNATRGQRLMYAVEWFWTEVMSGGVDTYFVNSSSADAPEALEGLRAIGANETADLLAAAMKSYTKNGQYLRDRDERSSCHGFIKRFFVYRTNSRLSQKLDSIDEDVSTLMNQWVMANPKEFFLD